VSEPEASFVLFLSVNPWLSVITLLSTGCCVHLCQVSDFERSDREEKAISWKTKKKHTTTASFLPSLSEALMVMITNVTRPRGTLD